MDTAMDTDMDTAMDTASRLQLDCPLGSQDAV
jgi:hypothetical protein